MKPDQEFRAWRDVLTPAAAIPRHVHAAPYAAIVLEGGYEEAGEAGRWRVEPGDVLIHAPFSAHCDLAPGRRTQVLNLDLPISVAEAPAAVRSADLDAVVRLAERDPRGAAALLLDDLVSGAAALDDAPDRLARELSEPASPTVEQWARAQRVTRETAFRWFRAVYGVGPARYRVEARARRAWRLLVGSQAPLAQVAADVGFADQAHMSREVRALTGRSPGAWRRASHSFKIDAA